VYRAQKNPRAHVAFQESAACIFRCNSSLRIKESLLMRGDRIVIDIR
jgi:hypothetical protein